MEKTILFCKKIFVSLASKFKKEKHQRVIEVNRNYSYIVFERMTHEELQTHCCDLQNELEEEKSASMTFIFDINIPSKVFESMMTSVVQLLVNDLNLHIADYWTYFTLRINHAYQMLEETRRKMNNMWQDLMENVTRYIEMDMATNTQNWDLSPINDGGGDRIYEFEASPIPPMHKKAIKHRPAPAILLHQRNITIDESISCMKTPRLQIVKLP